MKKILRGKAWKFGDDLGTDSHIFPLKYVREHWDGVPLEKLAHHLMEVANPEFGIKVQKGDFIVAGKNFGCGKGHRTGADCMKRLGVGAVIADSIGPRFFRYSVYFALPILIGDGVSEQIRQNDQIEVNVETGEIKNLSTGEILSAKPVIPKGHPLFPVMEAGGQAEYVKKKVAALRKACEAG
jgi:3-isopropylmalate/(R)-2-methylmalate dehydratase small subunit